MRKGGNADPHSDSIRRHSFRSGGGFLRSRKSNPFRSGVALRLRRARGADPSSAGQDSRRKGLKHEALPSGGGSNLRDAKQARCMTHQGCPRNGTATIEELSTLISQLCSELADAKTSANTRLSRLNAAARNAIHRADEACALRETVAAQRAEIAELRGSWQNRRSTRPRRAHLWPHETRGTATICPGRRPVLAAHKVGSNSPRVRAQSTTTPTRAGTQRRREA